jgi:hypothetical protein
MSEQDHGGRQRVFDPRGVVDVEPTPLAPRKASLGGLRLGVLDNTKWNANKLLRGSMAELAREHGFARVSYYRKESFSRRATPELLARIAAENDVALTAIGD